MALTLRSVKGSALTQAELDADLSGLASGANMTFPFALSGAVTIGGLFTASVGLTSPGGVFPGVAASTVGVFTNNNQPSIILIDASRTLNNKSVGFMYLNGIFYGMYTNDTYATSAPWLQVAGGQAAGITLIELLGPTRISSLGAFAAGDKYVIADATGHLHLSALGPAS